MQRTAAKRLHLRLFLEGIEVPVIAAQVQISINSPATASIQIVPADSALLLRARTMVHLFFWDFEDETTDLENPVVAAATDAELRGYKLLFAGEVVGISWQKTPNSRQCVLQCSDFSTYWDTTYQVLISYGPNGNFLWNSTAVWAGGSSMFDNIMSGHGSTLATYLSRKPKTPGLDKIGGLMGGIISLLEAMGGVPNHSHGVNDFFTIAELKNHILQQIVCEQNDDTAKRLFSGKQFWQWLMGGGQSLGELCTFRDMLMLLFKYIYYEVVPCPVARYVSTKQSTTTSTTKTWAGGKVQLPGPVVSKIQTMISEAQQNSNSSLTVALSSDKGREHFRAFNEFEKNTDIPKPARALLQRASNALMANENPDVMKRAASWGAEAKLLKKVLTLTIPAGSRTQVNKVGATADRLHTQFFRPDCFFVAPPVCNVLFPDDYMQFSYTRAFLQEITRLRLSLGWWLNPSGEGILGAQCYAPTYADIQKFAKLQGNNGLRALMPWEQYSGILPKFEKVNEINYISNKRDQQMKKGVTGAAANYGQRVANFNYMKYRFAARACEILARFKPRLIAGFPVVALDRPWVVAPDQVITAYSDKDVQQALGQAKNDDFLSRFKILVQELTARGQEPPTHFVGMLASLTHSADQKGGYSSISVSHARTHRLNEDDFLSVYAKQLQTPPTKLTSTRIYLSEALEKGDYTKLKYLIDATPQSVVRTNQSPQTGTATPVGTRPNGMPKTSGVPVDEDTDAFATASFLLLEQASQPISQPAAQTPPMGYQAPGGWGLTSKVGAYKQMQLPGTSDQIMVPDGPVNIKKCPKKGKFVAAQLYSDSVMAITPAHLDKFRRADQSKLTKLLGTYKEIYCWQSIVIWEEVKTSRKDTNARDIPIEEALRPPWFSPLYSNLFIGDEVYQPFFGCGSVVDEAVFVGTGVVGVFGANKSDRDNIMAQLKSANGDLNQIRAITEQARAQNLAQVPSVETAIDALAYAYGEVVRQGLDIHQFAANYNNRPVASLYDMFGSSDLEYSTVTKTDKKGNSYDVLQLVKGVSGFHSTAIAPYDSLLGLLDNPDLELPRLFKSGQSAPVSLTLDPRPGRRERVQDYADDLEQGHGVLGSGLRG